MWGVDEKRRGGRERDRRWEGGRERERRIWWEIPLTFFFFFLLYKILSRLPCMVGASEERRSVPGCLTGFRREVSEPQEHQSNIAHTFSF